MESTTRRLRAFIALAEHRHFGRAARQMFVTQQALSRQIATLEAEVGAPLVQRTTRHVELTASGERFLASCREALRLLDAGADAARGNPGILRLGFFVLAALELTDPMLAAFRRRRPGTEIVPRQFTFLDPTAGLAERSSDLAIVRLPIATSGLRFQRLFAEPRVAAVATGHPLARQATVSVVDLLDESVTVSDGADEAYRAFWTLADYRSEPMPPPVVTRSHAEELEVVASGRALSITSACAARHTPHPGVRFLAIRDVSETICALAWRAEDETDLIRDFAEGARQVVEQEQALVRLIEHPKL